MHSRICIRYAMPIPFVLINDSGIKGSLVQKVSLTINKPRESNSTTRRMMFIGDFHREVSPMDRVSTMKTPIAIARRQIPSISSAGFLESAAAP